MRLKIRLGSKLFININVIEKPLNLLQHVPTASNPSHKYSDYHFKLLGLGDGMIYYPPRFIRDPAVFTLLIFLLESPNDLCQSEI